MFHIETAPPQTRGSPVHSPILVARATLLVSMVNIPKLTLCPSHHLHCIHTHMHNVRLLCIQLRIVPLPPTLPSLAIIQLTPLSVSVCVYVCVCVCSTACLVWQKIKLPKSASQVLCSITYPTLPQSSSISVPDSEACVQRSVLLRPKHGLPQVSTPEAAAGVLYTALQGLFVYWMWLMPADTNTYCWFVWRVYSLSVLSSVSLSPGYHSTLKHWHAYVM